MRRKLVEFFGPHPGIGGDAQALRVSRYLGGQSDQRHTRLSVWDGERAVAAISLDEAETRRLGRFLGESGGPWRSAPDAVTTEIRRQPAGGGGR